MSKVVIALSLLFIMTTFSACMGTEIHFDEASIFYMQDKKTTSKKPVSENEVKEKYIHPEEPENETTFSYKLNSEE